MESRIRKIDDSIFQIYGARRNWRIRTYAIVFISLIFMLISIIFIVIIFPLDLPSGLHFKLFILTSMILANIIFIIMSLFSLSFPPVFVFNDGISLFVLIHPKNFFRKTVKIKYWTEIKKIKYDKTNEYYTFYFILKNGKNIQILASKEEYNIGKKIIMNRFRKASKTD